MRTSCTKCAKKHLSQALILMHESRQGYPAHYFIALGHMAEASDELVVAHYQQAAAIRTERLKLENDRNYNVPFLDLILDLDDVESAADSAAHKEA